MAPTTHSAFPASSAARLIACPGSYELGLALSTGDRRSTIYSAEGTLAHSLSEASLLTGADPNGALGRTFKTDGFEITPDEDFLDGVQTYVGFIQGLIAMGYLVALETRVSPQVHWSGLPDLGIDLFGTSDCIAYHPGLDELLIGDLKFGKGVAVEVKDNDQLRYYSAGSLNVDVINALLAANNHTKRVYPGWKPRRVQTVVIQPRAHHPDGPIRKHDYTADEIIDFARVRLYEGVKAALTDKGKTLNAGKHCRFCPVLAHCEAHREHMVETARQVFLAIPPVNVAVDDLFSGSEKSENTDADQAGATTAPDPLAHLPEVSLTDDMIGLLMDRIAILKPFIAAVEALAEARDVQSKGSIPGWTSVPTQPRRAWGEADEAAQIAQLHNAGLAPGDYTETKLLSPAQVQKRVGKRKYDQLVKQFVGRKSAGTKLVPVEDPRAKQRKGRTAQEAFGLPAPTQTTTPKIED